MNHYVTCYFEEGNETKYVAISKCLVPQFIEEHHSYASIQVCDPRNREITTYEYGEIKKQIS
ncbi:hypothetical protein [Bacillus sp. 1P06AnD]|uniref:hypothetical protein n=1 Tax=Bacillus sp. 1P06AnD TaxID=3132208 RepID=UPI0039A14821